MRFLITGGAPRNDGRPGVWEGHTFQPTWHHRNLFEQRPGETIPRADPARIDAFARETADYEAVIGDTPDAIVLVHEWARRGIPPRPILAIEVHSLGPVQGVREWYRTHQGVDPWPALLEAGWVSWIAASRRQWQILKEGGVPAEHIHRVVTSASMYSMLHPDGEELLSNPPAEPGPSARAVEGAVLFGGSGRRDWATALRTAILLKDVPCVMVGTSRRNLESHLRAWRVGWPANLTHLDFVPVEDYIEMVRAARVIAVPLLPGDGDGGHTTVALANRVGTAVVCTASPGLMDYYEAGVSAVVGPARDAFSLAADIRRVYSDEAVRERLVAGGRDLEERRDRAFRPALGAAIDRARAQLPVNLRVG